MKASRSSCVEVSTPYIAIQSVLARRWHNARSERVTVRLPPSPSSTLTHFDDPWVVMAVSRRTLVRRAFTRLAPAGMSHATPRTHTRSIQPLSIAG